MELIDVTDGQKYSKKWKSAWSSSTIVPIGLADVTAFTRDLGYT